MEDRSDMLQGAITATRTGATTAPVRALIAPPQTGREGGEMMKRTPTPKRRPGTRQAVGFVSLWADDRGRWNLRYTDPTTGRDVRRRLPVATESEAFELAVEANRVLLAGKQFPGMRNAAGKDALTVEDALAGSIRALRVTDATRLVYRKDVNRFLKWLDSERPQVRVWTDVTPGVLVAFLHSMQDAGLAYDTIRNALVPLKRAAAYWHGEDPARFRDVAKAACRQLKVERGVFKPPRALDPEQLQAFLDWTRVNAPDVHPIAILAGMAGLRLQEAAFLRHRDIDWAAGTVTVTTTPWHRPKTRTSERTIPVPDAALDAVRAYLDAQPVQAAGPDAPVFTDRRGRALTTGGLVRGTTGAMREARKAMPWLEGFLMRELRATFATLATQGGAPERLLQRYLGHQPPHILGRHYQAIGVGELNQVKQAFETACLATIWQLSGNGDL